MNTRKTLKCALVSALLILCACMACGCQPTPDEVVIIGKDQEAMLSAAVESQELNGYTLSTLVVPDRYQFSTEGADGKLTVWADADVSLPDAEVLPTAKVVPDVFTQEMVTGMLDYLFGDTPYFLMDNSGVMTKEEIENAIISMQASLADGTYADEPEMQAVIEQEIEKLKGQFDNAPETRDEPVLSDGMMIIDSETGASAIQVYSIGGDSEYGGAFFMCQSSADISTSIEAEESYISYSNYSSEDDDYSVYTMDGAVRIYADSDISDDLKAKLGVTLAEAQDLVQGLLDAAGIADMHCGAAYIVDDHGTGNVDEYTGPASDYAIQLYYSRSVDGSPVLTLNGLGQSTGSEYDYIWMYEDMEVLVTGGGIVQITWNTPCAVSEILTEDTNIIGFDQAAEIFEEKILTFYEAKAQYYGFASIDVHVGNVELGLLRIKQQNTEGTKAGLYVPVWAFYGTVTSLYAQEGREYVMYDHGCDFPCGPYIVLAVNAIDGSIIDINQGY